MNFSIANHALLPETRKAVSSILTEALAMGDLSPDNIAVNVIMTQRLTNNQRDKY